MYYNNHTLLSFFLSLAFKGLLVLHLPFYTSIAKMCHSMQLVASEIKM